VKSELEHDLNHIQNIEDDDASFPIFTIMDNNQSHKRISNEIFFACENCNGPLIQHTFCRICKKTDLRICLKCNHIKAYGDHRNCFCIVLLDTRKIFFSEGKIHES